MSANTKASLRRVSTTKYRTASPSTEVSMLKEYAKAPVEIAGPEAEPFVNQPAQQAIPGVSTPKGYTTLTGKQGDIGKAFGNIAQMGPALAGIQSIISSGEIDIEGHDYLDTIEHITDWATRPGKAAWAVIDDLTTDPLSGADITASTIGGVFGYTIPQRTGAAFMAGLSGKRGAVQFLNRLGIKESKIYNPTVQAKVANHINNFKKELGKIYPQGANMVPDGGMTSGAIEQLVNHFDKLVAFELEVGPLAALGKGALMGIARMGLNSNSKVLKAMGSAAPAFLSAANRSKLELQAMSESLKRIANAEEQSMIKKGLLDIMGEKPINIPGPAREVPKIKGIRPESLEVKVNKGAKPGKPTAEVMAPQPQQAPTPTPSLKFAHDEKFRQQAEAFFEREMRRIKADKLETAIAHAHLRSVDPAMPLTQMSQLNAYDRELLFRATRKTFGNMSKFEAASVDDVLAALPGKGRMIRAERFIARLGANKTLNRIAEKTFDQLSPQDMDDFFNVLSQAFPHLNFKSWFSAEGKAPFKTIMSLMNDYEGKLFKLQMPYYVFEEAGLLEQVFYPVLRKEEDKMRLINHWMNKVARALEPVNPMHMKTQLWGLKGTYERIAQFLDTGMGTLNAAEQRAADNLRGVLDDWAVAMGITEKGIGVKGGWRKNYFPHVMEDLEKAGFDFSGQSAYETIHPDAMAMFEHSRNPAMEGKNFSYNLVKVLETMINGGIKVKTTLPHYLDMKDMVQRSDIPAGLKAYSVNFLDWYGGITPIKSAITGWLSKHLSDNPLFAKAVKGASQEEIQRSLNSLMHGVVQWGYFAGLAGRLKSSIRNYFQRYADIGRSGVDNYFKASMLRSLKRFRPNHLASKALERIFGEAQLVAQRTGRGQFALPEAGNIQGKVYSNVLERATTAGVKVTGFNWADKVGVEQVFTANLLHEMKAFGIKKIENLRNAPKAVYDRIIFKANQATGESQVMFSRLNRPEKARVLEGALLAQYMSFGPSMLNLMLKQATRPSEQPAFIFNSVAALVLADTLNHQGLSGASYSAYLSGIGFFQDMLKGTENATKFVKAPSAKGVLGMAKIASGMYDKKVQYPGDVNAGEKDIQTGRREFSQMFSMGIQSDYEEVDAHRNEEGIPDVSRYLFYKPLSQSYLKQKYGTKYKRTRRGR